MDHFGAAKTPARDSTIPCEERHESPGTDVSRGGGVQRRRRAQRVEGLQSGARPPRQPAPAEARKIVSPPKSSQPSRRPAVRAPGQECCVDGVRGARTYVAAADSPRPHQAPAEQPARCRAGTGCLAQLPGRRIRRRSRRARRRRSHRTPGCRRRRVEQEEPTGRIDGNRIQSTIERHRSRIGRRIKVD